MSGLIIYKTKQSKFYLTGLTRDMFLADLRSTFGVGGTVHSKKAPFKLFKNISKLNTAFTIRCVDISEYPLGYKLEPTFDSPLNVSVTHILLNSGGGSKRSFIAQNGEQPARRVHYTESELQQIVLNHAFYDTGNLSILFDEPSGKIYLYDAEKGTRKIYLDTQL